MTNKRLLVFDKIEAKELLRQKETQEKEQIESKDFKIDLEKIDQNWTIEKLREMKILLHEIYMKNNEKNQFQYLVFLRSDVDENADIFFQRHQITYMPEATEQKRSKATKVQRPVRLNLIVPRKQFGAEIYQLAHY